MDLRPKVTIALDKYGGEGEITLSSPTFRRSNELSNKIAMLKGIMDKGATPVGSIYTLSIISYVTKAPFAFDLDEFLDYCDELDMKRVGAASELFAEMEKAVKALDSGDMSPFVVSQEAETANSDCTSMMKQS